MFIRKLSCSDINANAFEYDLAKGVFPSQLDSDIQDLDPGDTEARESVEESASEPGEPTPYDLFLSGKLSYAEAVAADRRENPEEYYDEDENESGEIPGDMDDDED